LPAITAVFIETMIQVAIIGCGVIGAAIAYELSRVDGLAITLLDEKVPASGSTGAALGVLMGIISQKTKGRAWQLRRDSLERYETLIPELEAIAGQPLSFNRQGILMLLFNEGELEKRKKLVEIRRYQGFNLEIWDRARLQSQCPHIDNEQVIGAVYSPRDRQINPTQLTQALVTGATRNGINCQFGVKVQKILLSAPDSENLRRCCQIQTTEEAIAVDWLVVAAGLGSTPLVAAYASSVDIRPVLGQALQLKLERSLGSPDFQPVMTGDDVHIVPLGNGEYWVGATVEFANAQGEIVAEPNLLETLRQTAIAFCPALADATLVRTWSGKRPRPQDRPAPIIGELPGVSNVLLATGHYRNGILLAPATAQAVRDTILADLNGSSSPQAASCAFPSR
jgi:glycine/D-amino acid oxidase-like deaminating enzyme